MTIIIRKHANSFGSAQEDQTLYSLETEAELEKFDRELDHDYVPMDIFIDPDTIKEHFRDSSIRARLKGNRLGFF